MKTTVKNMSIADITEGQQGKIVIYFHNCTNWTEAYDKIEPYRELGELQGSTSGDDFWLKVQTYELEVIAFLK